MRYFFEKYAFDTDRRELHRGADVVPLAPQVFDLLDYLIRNRERVVSKDDLIDAIWNGRIVSDAALTTRLNVTRTAIGDSGEEQRLIKTLPRKGFRFVGAVLEAQGPAGPATAGQSGPRARTPGLLSLTRCGHYPSGTPAKRMPSVTRSRPARYVRLSLHAVAMSR